MRAPALSSLLLMLGVSVMSGQQLVTRLPRNGAADPTIGSPLLQIAPEPGIHAPLLAAAGLGLLGWGIGAVAGGLSQADCGDEFCVFEGVFYGGAAGGGLGLAVGAHLGNRRRGSFLADLVVSGAVWGVGYAAMRSFLDSSDDTGVILTAVTLPPTQLVVTVLAERATGRARARRAE